MSEKYRSLVDLLAHAGKDTNLRSRLLTDAHGALADTVGAKLSNSVEIRVVEETPNHLYLVLPFAPSPEGELSDKELEQVAGGVPTDVCSWEANCANQTYCTACGQG